MSDMPPSLRALARKSPNPLRLLALASLTVGPACLVTNKVEYDQPIIPSQVKPITPGAEFARVPPLSDPDCNSQVGMKFEMEVRDLNVDEDLKVRALVNGKVVDDLEVRANGEEVREPSPFFCIDTAELRKDCNLVELAVSSGFKQSRNEPYRTREPNDLAIAHWWIIGNAIDDPNASYLDCNDQLRDAGVP